ncbi:hypothetical protein BKA61DRAFT_574840 [Leptodontidium sp. MPI-SDFR-AT-0119]|nr:hypothetical protein BKA61DRAFT_574840 [Leptodontidium sp. MPI-SDFR-AT-0119]
MDSSTDDRVLQSRWSYQTTQTELEACRVVTEENSRLLLAAQNTEANKDKVMEAQRRADAAHIWNNYVFLNNQLPDAADPSDPNEWIRKTNNGENIPSLFDTFSIIGRAIIKDKKITDFENKMPRSKRITEILQQRLYGISFQSGNKTKATVKHETQQKYDFTESSPNGAPADFLIYKETGLVQRPGFLYKKIHKFVVGPRGKVTTKLTQNWKSAQALYKNDPDKVKLQAPITPLEDIRINWIKAHISEKVGPQTTKIIHHGRDATYFRLTQGISSSIIKDVVSQLVDCCPGCHDRVETAAEAAVKAEPKREDRRAAKRQAEVANEPEQGPSNKRQRTNNGQQAQAQMPEQQWPVPLPPQLVVNNYPQQEVFSQFPQQTQISGGHYAMPAAGTFAPAGDFNLEHIGFNNYPIPNHQNNGQTDMFSVPTQPFVPAGDFNTGHMGFNNYLNPSEQYNTGTGLFSLRAELSAHGSYQNPEPTGTQPANDEQENQSPSGEINHLNIGGASRVQEPIPDTVSEVIALMDREFPPGSLVGAISNVVVEGDEPSVSQPKILSPTVPEAIQLTDADFDHTWDELVADAANGEATASNVAEPIKETEPTSKTQGPVTINGLTFPAGAVDCRLPNAIQPAKEAISQEANEDDNDSSIDYLFEGEGPSFETDSPSNEMIKDVPTNGPQESNIKNTTNFILTEDETEVILRDSRIIFGTI